MTEWATKKEPPPHQRRADRRVEGAREGRTRRLKVNREMTRALGVVTSMLAIGPLLVIAIKETLEQKQYPAFVMDWSIPFSLVLWFGAVWGCGFLVGVGRRDE